MEQEKKSEKMKGGRPVKNEKMSCIISLKCTLAERQKITEQALKARMSLSKYIRHIAITGKVVVKDFPPEVLHMRQDLAGLGNNFNQLARKKNSLDGMTAMDIANLRMRLKDIEVVLHLFIKWMK